MSPIWRSAEPADRPLPTLFLDRDGVLIRDRDYLSEPEGVELLSGVAEALLAARQAGFVLIGVSNQSGLGRGYFTPEQFRAVMQELDRQLGAAGASLDGFYYCPHAPDQDCGCRKPLPGLLEEAAQATRWDPLRSWVIGDKMSDVQLGRNAGLGGCLVRTGYGAQQEERVRKLYAGDDRVCIVDDLPAAVAWILGDRAGEGRK